METHNETDTEHTPEEYSKVANSLYILHSYMMIVYIYYIIISILLVVGVHTVSYKLFYLFFYSIVLGIYVHREDLVHLSAMPNATVL